MKSARLLAHVATRCKTSDESASGHDGICDDVTAAILIRDGEYRAQIAEASAEVARLRGVLERLGQEPCAFDGSYANCWEAIEADDIDAGEGIPCARCVSLQALEVGSALSTSTAPAPTLDPVEAVLKRLLPGEGAGFRYNSELRLRVLRHFTGMVSLLHCEQAIDIFEEWLRDRIRAALAATPGTPPTCGTCGRSWHVGDGPNCLGEKCWRDLVATPGTPPTCTHLAKCATADECSEMSRMGADKKHVADMCSTCFGSGKWPYTPCPTCDGTGRATPGTPPTCRTCGGTREIAFMVGRGPCPDCGANDR